MSLIIYFNFYHIQQKLKIKFSILLITNIQIIPTIMSLKDLSNMTMEELHEEARINDIDLEKELNRPSLEIPQLSDCIIEYTPMSTEEEEEYFKQARENAKNYKPTMKVETTKDGFWNFVPISSNKSSDDSSDQ